MQGEITMFARIKILVAVSLMIVAAGSFTQAVAATDVGSVLAKLDLSDEQLARLAELGIEFNQKQFAIASDIAGKYDELASELKREGRFETEEKAKISSDRANVIVRDLSRLYGQILKTRVQYLLEAKDILTPGQRIQLIKGLDFDVEVPGDLSYYQKVDVISVGLGLSDDQIRRILRYRTDMQINQLKLVLEIEYKILDLEAELVKEQVDSAKVNNVVMDVTDLATQMLDNRVDHFIKAKDVLTVTQKKKLLHLIMVTQQ